MDLTILPISFVSIFTIILIITGLIFAYYKKWMMTYAIIFINFTVFIISLIFRQEVVGQLAFRPIYLSFQYFPQLYTLFTSTFLHSTSDVLHIIFNVFMFILIAPSFEEKVGPKKFLLIYILTGILAGLSHAIFAPLISPSSFDSTIGLVGASGAISGILGAYAYSYPKDKVLFPVFFIIRMPVLIAGLIFLSFQTLYVAAGADSNVAYLAHIGGFLSGIVIAAIFIRKKGPGLYDPTEKRDVYGYVDTKRNKIDFSKLEQFANTPELKDMLIKIKNETVLQVREIWLEYFFEKANCPKCANKLNHFDRKIWCENCGFKESY
jgi:membrane associated rhomboid family serine protease